MIALDGPARDNRIGVTTIDRIGHDKFELARLVASPRQTELVVAFDPKIDAPAQGLRQGRQRLDRGRTGRVLATGEVSEIHG
jgi:hypothetical protein